MVRLKIAYWEFVSKAMLPTLDHNLLSQAHIQSLKTGYVPLTQQRGILTRKAKDLPCGNLANWHPISLLNKDYKILAKALALTRSHHKTDSQ